MTFSTKKKKHKRNKIVSQEHHLDENSGAFLRIKSKFFLDLY